MSAVIHALHAACRRWVGRWRHGVSAVIHALHAACRRWVGRWRHGVSAVIHALHAACRRWVSPRRHGVPAVVHALHAACSRWVGRWRHAVSAVIHALHRCIGCWLDDVLHAGRTRIHRCIAGQALADGAHQRDPCKPVVAHRFQITLIGVVLLDLGLKQFEHADQHEVLFLLAALDHDFALRNQCIAMDGDDPAEFAHFLGTKTYGVAHAQLCQRRPRPRFREQRLGAGHLGLALVEDR